MSKGHYWRCVACLMLMRWRQSGDDGRPGREVQSGSRMDAPADPRARLDDAHVRAALLQLVGCGKAGADNENGRSGGRDGVSGQFCTRPPSS